MWTLHFTEKSKMERNFFFFVFIFRAALKLSAFFVIFVKQDLLQGTMRQQITKLFISFRFIFCVNSFYSHRIMLKNMTNAKEQHERNLILRQTQQRNLLWEEFSTRHKFSHYHIAICVYMLENSKRKRYRKFIWQQCLNMCYNMNIIMFR